MTALRSVASLDERSVQGVANGSVRRSRKRADEQRPRTARASSARVDELVMREAHELVESGSYRRIEIVDATTVIVR